MSGNDIKIVLVAKHSKNEKFENLLKQVFPTEIPVTMIDTIIIEFRDGTNAKLDHAELIDSIHFPPMQPAKNDIQAPNVAQINIVVDVRKVEKDVGKNVSEMLGKHFD